MTGIGSPAFARGRYSPLPQADTARHNKEGDCINRFMSLPPDHNVHGTHPLAAPPPIPPRGFRLQAEGQPPERAIERHGLENHIRFGGCRPRLRFQRRLGGTSTSVIVASPPS